MRALQRCRRRPIIEGDKIMRLHAQTAKIEGGFVLFPKEAPWMDAYIQELGARLEHLERRGSGVVEIL